MPLAVTIKRFLEQQDVPFDILRHPRAESLLQAAAAAYVSPRSIARAALLKDRGGFLMAVFPASHVLDLPLLNKELRRDFDPATGEDLARIFRDCEPGALPPLAEPYRLKAMVDESLHALEEVYFSPGSHTALVQVTQSGFERLQRNAWRGSRIARPTPELSSAAAGADWRFGLDIRRRIEQIQTLPALPQMAQRILQLRRNPYAGARQLAHIVELDPSLAAQVLRYARSPLFGYRGPLNSIQDAIARVLGYDTVMNIALGIAVGRAFNAPRNGPLGLDAYWRHAIQSAALVQGLANALPAARRPRPGIAYLAGLLHDFGYLVLSHLFQPEFYWLNRIVAAEPDTPVTDVEMRVLGVSHAELGAWVMEAWHMPEELLIAVREHHNEAYRDAQAVYPNLVFAADRLLKQPDAAALPAELLRDLNLTAGQVTTVLNALRDNHHGLDALAGRMTA